MGVAATHYVVLGVALRNKAQIKKFFQTSEEHLEFCDKYDDNGYKDKPTPTDSGIHMIVDGMCGEYVVIGKILSKGIEEGLPFTQMDVEPSSGKNYVAAAVVEKKVVEEILKIDRELGTKFGELPLQYLAFTHWH